jgi:uncharacterized membrane protein YagU involved in acid resistance
LGALARGLAAGLVGTAVMTGYQTALSMKRGLSLKDAVAPDPPDHWKDAPAPGQVGYRFLHGLFEKDVSPDHSTTITNVVHWLYGTGWGGLYGLAEASIGSTSLVAGSAFGSLVFANAYVALPAMGLYKPPWKYDTKTLGVDWSYHVVYGVATAAAFRALQSRPRWG